MRLPIKGTRQVVEVVTLLTYTAIGGKCHAQFLITNGALTTISPD
jgi:hypothetical protein